MEQLFGHYTTHGDGVHLGEPYLQIIKIFVMALLSIAQHATANGNDNPVQQGKP